MVASRSGFTIRFEGMAMIKFLTNGALIREMMCYPLLRKYRCHVMTLPEVINLSGNASPISGGKRFDLHQTNRVNSFLRQWRNNVMATATAGSMQINADHHQGGREEKLDHELPGGREAVMHEWIRSARLFQQHHVVASPTW